MRKIASAESEGVRGEGRTKSSDDQTRRF